MFLKSTFRWAGIVAQTVLVVIMGTLVFFAVTSKLSQDGVPRFGGYQMMVVLSGSMSPAFEAGDVIITSTNTAKQFKPGDVITFKDSVDTKKIITHRVVEIIPDGTQLSYRTKGDANNTVDQTLVPAANLMGQQKWHIPYLGWLIEFSKTKQGIIFLVIIPGLLILVNEFRTLLKAVAEEASRKARQEAIVKPWVEE